jgi:hypothetical protein
VASGQWLADGRREMGLTPHFSLICLTTRRKVAPLYRPGAFAVALIVLIAFALPHTAFANDDWNQASRQLTQKIVAVTGPGAIAVTIENRSSLGKKDFDSISGAFRAQLEALGIRAVSLDQSAASVQISLSENPRFYVWVAEIRQGNAEPVIAIVSFAHGDEVGVVHDALPMSLRKILLWAQEERILDVAVLDEDSSPQHIAVLDAEKVAIYRQKNGKWQTEQSLAITHARPWPRDLRGRIAMAKDHLFDVYLPGVFCRTTTGGPPALSCHETDDPWPLAGTAGVQSLAGFYAASRNFFTGALTPGVGKLTNVGKFYSAAALPRANYVLWLFAGTDGQTHLVDGVTDQSAKLNWGSDLVSVRTGCGIGWQVLASARDAEGEDSLRAFEIVDRDPVPVSGALEFSGEITALWADVKNDSAIAIVHEVERGEYEAFRVAVACSE